MAYQLVRKNHDTGEYESVLVYPDYIKELCKVKIMKVKGQSVIVNENFVIQKMGRKDYRLFDRTNQEDWSGNGKQFSTAKEAVDAAWGK
jgi:hypothetical protein